MNVFTPVTILTFAGAEPGNDPDSKAALAVDVEYNTVWTAVVGEGETRVTFAVALLVPVHPAATIASYTL